MVNSERISTSVKFDNNHKGGKAHENTSKSYEDKTIFTERERKWPYLLQGSEKFGFSVTKDNCVIENFPSGTSLEGAAFSVQRMNFKAEAESSISKPVVRSHSKSTKTVQKTARTK